MAKSTMKTRIGQLVVWVLPPGFVLVSWWVATGFPYYLDSNETFLSYVHARNLEPWNPAEYGWLTAEATDPDVQPLRTCTPTTRTVRAICTSCCSRLESVSWRCTSLCSGCWPAVDGLVAHTDVSAAGVAGGGAGRSAGLCRVSGLDRQRVPCLDLRAVLWSGAGYCESTPGWAAVLTFLLFQVESGTALFVGVTVTALVALLHGWGTHRLVLASAAGAVLSLAVFAGQVLTYLARQVRTRPFGQLVDDLLAFGLPAAMIAAPGI